MSKSLDAMARALSSYHRRHISVPRAERIAEAAVRLLQPYAAGGGSLLDVGCGDGEIARQVADGLRVASVRGTDVLLRDSCAVDVDRYDGERLPYGDRSYDLVMLSDVLHHARAPELLLRECLRVTRRALLVKDHFAHGVLSKGLLWLMDIAGNAEAGVAVTGRYFSPEEWIDMVASAGGRLGKLCWPLRIHDLPWRLVTRSELQFAAVVLPLNAESQSETEPRTDHAVQERHSG